jgi:hypothetical protein
MSKVSGLFSVSRLVRGVALGVALGAACGAGPAVAMELADVQALLEAGVGEDVILGQMEAEGARFQLETADILELRHAGASDHLLRAMIESGDTRRAEREAARAEEERAAREARLAEVERIEVEPDDWTRDYYGVDRELRIDFVYDPFGYYWYACPSYFVYYYPFRTWDIGVYFAGWHHWRWWGWDGYWCSYYRDYCDDWYWRRHHRPYYHDGWNGHDEDVRYRGRADRGPETKATRSRTPGDDLDRRDRVSRSRSGDAVRTDRGRTRGDAPERDRTSDPGQPTPRVREEASPRTRSSQPETPSEPSRAPRSQERSEAGGGRGRGR